MPNFTEIDSCFENLQRFSRKALTSHSSQAVVDWAPALSSHGSQARKKAIDGLVDQVLGDGFPGLLRCFLEILEGWEAPFLVPVDLFSQCVPNEEVKRIAVWTVRWPLGGGDEARSCWAKKALIIELMHIIHFSLIPQMAIWNYL